MIQPKTYPVVSGTTTTGSLPEKTARAAVASPTLIKALADLPALRTPTPEHRRVIFRALDEAYDEPNKCYVPGFTDQTIADKLKFPRAWITERRETDFGPAGADPAIAELRAELASMKLVVEASAAKHLNAAADLENDGVIIGKLIGRVEKLEAKHGKA